ncbi:pre-mRNA-splicing factor CWC22 homolog [Brassica napus]|uniref:pre-mRNA-splicing factor CWC22 homolog n=1 Tax=Brassica napus TaxID=3708 RepID=UPI0006A6ABEB|nr:PREDICTED: pre-mRNA-splicing factor CWC22 homolog isoform X2 [Brassica oleracea var. oleracea]XP_013680612.1 pre-mRNA-splicing factor CWC22 homolog [Brassica napus]XP_022556514.1 pre-mRNA-splicing factor CWC22 homolog [Brassica napus]
MASPGFTDVFAALVSVINAKFPEVAELLLKRIVSLMTSQVAEEIIALEIVSVLLETPTDDSVEVAVGFVTECGAMLQEKDCMGSLLLGKQNFRDIQLCVLS